MHQICASISIQGRAIDAKLQLSDLSPQALGAGKQGRARDLPVFALVQGLRCAR
jgi:hypothetical protein